MTATRTIQARLRLSLAVAAIGLSSLVAASAASAGGLLPIAGIGAQPAGGRRQRRPRGSQSSRATSA